MPQRHFSHICFCFGMIMALAACGDAPRIERFEINGGADRTDNLKLALNTVVSGKPDGIRASERQDLAGAKWKSYTPAFTYFVAEDGPARRTVYVQVRRGEQVSSAAADTITVEPPGQDYQLPLDSAVAFARSRGWRFTASGLNPLSICEIGLRRDAIALVARQGEAGVNGACRFEVFAGKGLAKGWRFKSQTREVASHSWCEMEYTALPLKRRAAFAWDITIHDRDTGAARKTASAGPPPGCTYTIVRIVLRGPPGAAWRDAFR